MASTAQQRLASRAKWRRFFQKWTGRFILILLVLVIGVLVLFSQLHILVKPAIIAEVEKYIEEDEDPPAHLIRRMYNIGVLLELSMRGEEAKKCYETLLDWVYDADGTNKFDIIKMPDDYDAILDADFDPVIGYALFRYSEILKSKYKHRAFYVRKMYLRDIVEQENSDHHFNELVKMSQILYRSL